LKDLKSEAKPGTTYFAPGFNYKMRFDSNNLGQTKKVFLKELII